MGGKVGNYLNPKTFISSTQDAFKQGKILASGKGKLSNFVTGADDIVDLGLVNSTGLTNKVFGGGSTATADPSFNFDPNQSANDQAAINAEGERQYQQSLAGINDVSTAETQRAKDLFGEMLPDIAENAQAAHLYDSTGYGNEVARQQSGIASQVAEQQANQRLSALGAKQGFQTGAVQRGMGLEDFVNQANVAKAIGAQMAPQAPSSKATAISGGVSGASAGASFGPWGAAIGGVGGALLGSQANKKQGQGGK